MRIPALSLVLASVSGAQVVSPAHFANAEGPGSSTTPFGLLVNDDRYLQVHSDVTTPLTIQRIVLRRDQAADSIGSTAFNATLRLSAAAAGVTAATPSPVFALNHGAGLVTFTGLSVNMPATVSPTLPGRPFDRVIPLPSPYHFPGGASLVWEVELTYRTPTFGGTFDAVSALGDPNPAPAIGSFGSGCRVSAADAPLNLEIQSSIGWRGTSGTGTFVCTTTNALRENSTDNRVFLLVGLSRTLFGGAPLPFSLAGTGGAPSGQCTLYSSIGEIVACNPVNISTGASSSMFQWPMLAEFNGASLYFQSLALSIRANPYLIALSNAVAVQVIAPYGPTPIGRVSGNGHGASITGTASPLSGLVTLFQ